MNNIPNDVLEEIILNKVKLFSKESYYRQFRDILLELYKNIFAFKKKDSLSVSMMSKIKERNNSSLWHIISILIFPLKYHLKDEEIYLNDYNLDPLSFQYLKNLCYTKMKKLTNLAMIERVSLERVIPIYLNLCEKQIKTNKEKKKGTLRLKGNYLQINSNRKASILLRQNSLLNRPKINLKKINKNGPSIQPLEYANSFTRLFIGETDEASIRERYLSNMIVKKQKQLHLLNSYGELSIMYLKKMYKKLFKNEGAKGTMDNDMINIMKQFENDHKRIDNFQRNSSSNDNPHYMIENNHYLLLSELNKQKEKVNNAKNKNRNAKIKRSKINFNNYNSNSLYNSAEVSKNNRELNLKSLYFRKNKNNSMNYEKNKKNDALAFNKRIINSYGSYKLLNAQKNNIINSYGKNLKKNFSVVLGRNKFKSYSSSSFTNNKKFFIKNYMNKSDFFFS
jgi:hypothetical protein